MLIRCPAAEGYSAALFFLLRVLIEVPNGVEHEIVRQGTVPGFRPALGVDNILGGGKLMEEVKAFEAEDEFAVHERLAEGGIEYEVIGIQRSAAIATTAVHGGIGGESHAANLLAGESGGGVFGAEAIAEVEGIEGGEIVHLALAVPPADIARGA